jgi:outer membrane protein OmpA-like peptidoglycan-associated protein
MILRLLSTTAFAALVCCAATPVLAQKNGKADNGKTKAKAMSPRQIERTVRDADKNFLRREIVTALALYQSVYDQQPDNYYVTYRLGRCNWYLGETQKAIDYYNAARQVDAERNDTLLFDLGIALKKIAQYGNAKKMFEDFLAKYDVKDDYLVRQAKFELKGIEEADKLSKVPKDEYKYFVANLGDSVNTEGSDLASGLYAVKADSFLIFTSARPGNRGKKIHGFTNEKFKDLYWVKMENDSTFGKPENLGKKVNTKANDGSAVIDPTGRIMYYTICGGGKFKKYWGCSIYQSEFIVDAKSWGKPRKVEGLNGEVPVVVNTRGKTKSKPTYDAQPSLSADGNTMYFVSNRPGGLGETDIWYSKRAGQAWGTPQHCGPNVNSPYSEIYPFIGQDGKTLYFASNGQEIGLGGYDIYKAEGKDATWEKPENLGIPINSSYNDFALIWFIQDSTGQFTSDRAVGMDGIYEPSKGRDDIFRMRKIYRPPVVITVQGTVRDRDTKQVIPFATVTLYKSVDGKLVPVDTFQTSQNGFYEFSLEKNSNYKLIGNAPEYFAQETFIETPRKSTTLQQDLDIFLDRIYIDEPIVLQNIYYDYDKSDLRPESTEELNRLLKILNDNPSIIIQLGSHTDSNGSEKYNIALSQRRAKSVYDFLIQNGIPKGRLSSFAFGESQPLIYPELSDSDEQANRRTEFRVKAMDYDPANEGKAQPKKK